MFIPFGFAQGRLCQINILNREWTRMSANKDYNSEPQIARMAQGGQAATKGNENLYEEAMEHKPHRLR
jgi:hypothetical protein